ncbi:hypothetical protein D9M72_542400 [compost metagenome]
MLAVVGESRVGRCREVLGHRERDRADGQLRECQGAEVLLHVTEQGGAYGFAVEDAAGHEGADHGSVLVGLQQRADFVHEPQGIEADGYGFHVNHGKPSPGFEEVLIGQPAGVRVRSAHVHA